MWVQYVLATWGPLLLLEAGVAELGQAGLLASVQGITGVAGLLGGGWLADRAVRAGVERRMVLIGSQAALAIVSAVLAAALHRGVSAGLLSLGLALVAVTAWAVWGPAFAVLGETFAGRDLSTAFGVYNSICVLGAFLGPAVSGWVRDVTGSFVVAGYVSVAVALASIACIVTRRASPGEPGGRGL
jgi:ACS family tartrate transporter-like MFS transporter